MNDLTNRIDRLTPAKRRLLEQMLDAQRPRARAAPGTGAISRRTDSAPAPLSFSQQRLWFVDQLQPDRPHYNVAARVHLRGPLDVDLLERCFQETIARHEVLRTRLVARDGQPRQIVDPALDWSLARVDLSGLSPAARELETCRHVREQACRPFDLSRGPMIRASAVRLDAEDYLLLLTLHHVACDGWSMGVLEREIGELYAAYRAGRSSPLAELPIQYADYAAWQRNRIDGPLLAEHATYWKRRLAGAPAELELATDFARPAVQSHHGAEIRRVLPRALASAFQETCGRSGATLFMGLLAALQATLARTTGQTDICIGTPVAGRTAPELESLIGFFVNTLVLRGDLTGNPTFAELLEATRQSTLDALEHQEYPFEKLVDALHVPRDLGRTPLFQVMLVLQNTPRPASLGTGVEVVESDMTMGQSAVYDMTLNVREAVDGLHVALVYNADLFEAPTIGHFLDAIEAMLEGVVRQPAIGIRDVPLVPESGAPSAAAGSAPASVTGTQPVSAAGASASCVHHLFEKQAAASPDAIALVCESESLTYRELDRRANRLAHELQHCGAGPDVLVGLCLPRGADLIVGMLAILKSGGAYLPLDPDDPTEALLERIDDARPRVVLTDANSAGRLDQATLRCVCVDRDLRQIEAQPSTPPRPALQPENLAYVIYTSGSSGQAKGVEIEHRGLAHLAGALVEPHGLTPGMRVLQFLSLGFDAAGEEIFPTLACGATLVMVREPRFASAADIVDFCRAQQIELVHFPPAIWTAVMEEIARRTDEASPRFKTVVIGGDVLPPEKLELWNRAARRHGARLMHVYGVTEATITSSWYFAGRSPEDARRARLPIGRPMPGVQMHVVDERLRPVPQGARGELVIGGIGVARGYRNRPELTAERFVADPFDDRPGARMYRTGDLARIRADGCIEFLGRADRQVKIRGYRIEPAQIEAAMARHPAILQSAVVVHVPGCLPGEVTSSSEPRPGQKRLLGYYTCEAENPVDPSQLRSLLHRRLPEHMIPAILIRCASMPLGPTGKIDRAQLAERPIDSAGDAPASRSQAFGSPAPRPPESDIERTLATIWSEVLGIESIGTDDNFFELGGDSILSIQVVARAATAGVTFTPKQLFEHQTIRALAKVAGTRAEIAAEQGRVSGRLELTPIQRRFFLAAPSGTSNPQLPLRAQAPDIHHFNQSMLLKIDASVSPETIERALDQLVERHDALRLRFRLAAAGWIAEHAATGVRIPLARVDLSASDPAQHAAAIAEHATIAQETLDISKGPIARAVRFDLGTSQRGRLLLVVHHLAVDAVSWRIILDDLQSICAAELDGAPAPAAKKTTSFQAWARRLVEASQSHPVREQLDYWLSLAPTRPSEIPIKAAEIENTFRTARRVTVALSRDETTALLREAPAAYHAQPADLLTAAMAQSLTRWTGGRRHLVDLEGHGREELFDDVSLARTVGWFTSVFPVRLAVPYSDDPGEHVRAAKEQLRRVPSGGIGYGMLRYLTGDAAIAEQLSKLPNANIAMNYLGQVDRGLAPRGLFHPARESAGPDQSPGACRWYELELECRVQDGVLEASWIYSHGRHDDESIRRLADDFLESLRRTIGHCLAPDSGGFTPSDFPLAGVDESELALLAGLLGEEDESSSPEETLEGNQGTTG